MRKKKFKQNAINSSNELYINEKQLNKLIAFIELSHDNQYEKIANILVKINEDNQKKDEVNDGFSKFVRWALTALFCGFGAFMIFGVFTSIKAIWKNNFINDLSVIILIIISIYCIALGICIHKIKNRNYLISVFSTLVALTALIVALIK